MKTDHKTTEGNAEMLKGDQKANIELPTPNFQRRTRDHETTDHGTT